MLGWALTFFSLVVWGVTFASKRRAAPETRYCRQHTASRELKETPPQCGSMTTNGLACAYRSRRTDGPKANSGMSLTPSPSCAAASDVRTAKGGLKSLR